MTEYPPQRPAAVTVIGWGSIALAVVMLVGGLGGLPVAAFIYRGWKQMLGPNLPPGFDQIAGFVWYIVPLLLLHSGIAVVMMVASILLLRLRESGRRMLEALNWFGLAFAIALNAWLIPAWSRAVARAIQALPAQQARGVIMLAPAMAVPQGLVQLAIIGLVIWVLRSKTVRSAMRP